MSKQPKSDWRRESRRIISEVLAALPAGAAEADRRRALRAAYPFGRREMHPYKMWLAEVRLALAAPAPGKAGKPAVVYRLDFDPEGEGPASTRTLVVRCGWCNSRNNGCMMCAGHLRKALAVVRLPEFKGLYFAVSQGTTPPGILRDWLAEQGIEVQR